MSAPDLNEDFLDMIDALSGAGVEFLVVGAHALAAHGLPRATGDLDLLVRADPDNAARVYAALEDFGAPVEAHGVKPEDFERPESVYQIGLSPRRVDLLTSISGVSFDEAWADKLEVVVAGRRVFVIGRPVANKQATGRPRDLLDVEELTRR